MPSSIESTGITLLVVDDNRDAADTLAWVLETWGYVVRAVYSASEALDAVKVIKPRCVLSDLEMPVLDGYGLAASLRQDDAFQGLALIALSGNGTLARAKAAGFDYFLVKPANLLLLKEILRKISANTIAQRECRFTRVFGFSSPIG